MIVYPYWKVPFSIAWKEILPAVQNDTSYLRRKGFEVIGQTPSNTIVKFENGDKRFQYLLN